MTKEEMTIEENVNFLVKTFVMFFYIFSAGFERSTRAVSFRSEKASRALPSLELDTVVEERSDPEQSTALELSSPD